MVALLDANVLIALIVSDHEHHGEVAAWWGEGRAVATCPITQGALLRFCLRVGVPPTDAMELLDSVTTSDNHQFWPDELEFDIDMIGGLRGHRQVTDAYLVALAAQHGGVLATLDRGLAHHHGDVVELLA